MDLVWVSAIHLMDLGSVIEIRMDLVWASGVLTALLLDESEIRMHLVLGSDLRQSRSPGMSIFHFIVTDITVMFVY